MPDFRVYDWHRKQMFHHPRGFMDGKYIVFANDKKIHKNLGTPDEMVEVEVPFDEAEYLPFIDAYDDTKWEELSKVEQNFWNLKGFEELNWKGKKIYEGDLYRVTCEDGKEVLRVARRGTLLKKGIYVVGNLFQNPELLGVRAADAELMK